MFILDARKAGRTPPMKPMISEKSNDFHSIPKVSAKEKASSENDAQFMVEMVMSCMKDAAMTPSIPPHSPKRSASMMKANSMLLLWKPNARRVPISVTRFATAAYMVMVAPMTAPMEKTMV